MSEVALVLKSVTILISALKDARKTTAKSKLVWKSMFIHVPISCMLPALWCVYIIYVHICKPSQREICGKG